MNSNPYKPSQCSELGNTKKWCFKFSFPLSSIILFTLLSFTHFCYATKRITFDQFTTANIFLGISVTLMLYYSCIALINYLNLTRKFCLATSGSLFGASLGINLSLLFFPGTDYYADGFYVLTTTIPISLACSVFFSVMLPYIYYSVYH
jgi:hypothetical protein